MASRRALTDGDWTPDRVKAWDNSREMFMNAVALSFRRSNNCLFPDANDLFWGCCLTHVLKEELVSGLSFMGMSHEPLAFLSGVFRGSQLCLPTVDKEPFAIMSAFQRLPYLLWDVGEHLLLSSQLGVHLHPAIMWRDVKQCCVATSRRVACMHEPVQSRDPAHPRGG